MTLMTRDAPAGGLTALEQALRHIGTQQPEGKWAEGGSTIYPTPMELFTVGLDAIKDVDFMKYAVPNGWRYLVSVGQPAMADVRDAAQPSFANLTRGSVAARLLQATHLAEKGYGSSPVQFEARVLEIPALYVIALWLYAAHDNKNAFFWVADGERMTSLAVGEDPKFPDAIVVRAKARLALLNP